jgi:2-methylisocitrate lyase-like PEP mutase family enzyme
MSLITMTQHLDMLRAIAARTKLPIVADIDTGYGNAVNGDTTEPAPVRSLSKTRPFRK